MGVVTLAASTAGVVSIPTPITEASWDGWLLHRYFGVEKVTGDAGGGFMALELDSKAMRKGNEDEVLAGVLDVVETGVAVANVQVRVRALTMIG